MHELSIAQSIVTIAEEHLPAAPGTKVRAVRVTIGELAGVVVDSLEFCFSAVSAGTRLEGAQLVIDHVAARGRCPTCGTVAPIEGFAFLCTRCGGAGLELVEGDELQVTELELDEQQEQADERGDD